MLNYELSDGGDLRAPEHWPAGSRIPRTLNQPTLVVFAHPRCPCTEATFDELAEIATKAGSAATISVIFFTPTAAGPDWTQSLSVRRAAAIPGVKVVTDENGREARIFRASTSGRTLLYHGNGALIFDGGITSSRGESGSNVGADTLAALLAGGEVSHASTPVFGCPILGKSTAR